MTDFKFSPADGTRQILTKISPHQLRLRPSSSMIFMLSRTLGLPETQQHQYRPQQWMGVSRAGEMLLHQVQRCLLIDMQALKQLLAGKPVQRPFFQWAAQPFVDRHAESLFGPVQNRPRHVAVSELSEKILILAATQLPRRG